MLFLYTKKRALFSGLVFYFVEKQDYFLDFVVFCEQKATGINRSRLTLSASAALLGHEIMQA